MARRRLIHKKTLVAKEEIDIICIQETKMTNITKEKCYTLWGNNNIDWVHYGSETLVAY